MSDRRGHQSQGSCLKIAPIKSINTLAHGSHDLLRAVRDVKKNIRSLRLGEIQLQYIGPDSTVSPLVYYLFNVSLTKLNMQKKKQKIINITHIYTVMYMDFSSCANPRIQSTYLILFDLYCFHEKIIILRLVKHPGNMCNVQPKYNVMAVNY